MKVGDYVRTNEGIGKITKYKYEPEYENCHVIWFDNDNYGIRYADGEIKPSPNIIDLIEVGDYVNELRVEKNKYGDLYTSYVYYGGDIGKQCEVYTTWLKDYDFDEIKSIVTKEQFESMEYKVK